MYVKGYGRDFHVHCTRRYIRFWSYLAQFFLERKIFQTNL